VEIWTICGGDPPAGPLTPFAQTLHDRWELGREAAALRRQEDETACGIVGAGFRHLDLPDCIYRRHPDTGEPLYTSDWAIFGTVAEVEADRLVGALADRLKREILPAATVFAPLGLGNHVDHQITRRAAETLGERVHFYADLPYVLFTEPQIPELVPDRWAPRTEPVSAVGLQAWCAGSAAYASQISSFWPDKAAMVASLTDYCEKWSGIRVWGSRNRNE
jgi:LmbE family N-acetylglucosaminyl deacetylase